MKIDAHQHFWDLTNKQFDYSWMDTDTNRAIHKTYLPETLKPHLDAAGIEKCVFVQTQHDVAENRWALDLAEQYDWIAGVVGWIDLASEHCESQLLHFKDHPKFVGIRHITHDESDDDFIVRPNVLRGLGILQDHQMPFDLLFFVRHLHHAKQLGETFPNLPMVIDHLAKPEITAGNIDNWKKDFVAASKFPNIFCKLSGLITEANWQNWKTQDLRPYVELALQHFGASRCMYGSDWPVCELAGSYADVHNAFIELVDELSDAEKNAIWCETAKTFYGLRF